MQVKFRRSLTSLAVSVLLGILLTSAARADSAPIPMSGGHSIELLGAATTDITLVQNTVRLRIGLDKCSTRAFYRFQNTGAAVSVKIGLPLSFAGEAADFELLLDRVPTATENYTDEAQVKQGNLSRQYWKVWTVHFAPGQLHLVEVRYSNKPQGGEATNFGRYGTYSWWRNWVLKKQDYNLKDYGHNEAVALHDWTTIWNVRYTLPVAKQWKGPIQQLRVEAEIAEVPVDALMQVAPGAQSYTPKQIVWEMKSLVDATKIELAYLQVKPETIISYLQKIVTANPQDAPLRDTLKEVQHDFPDAKTIRHRQRRFMQ